MSKPKLHHYVPRFYLRRFVDAHGRLWVWDRGNDRTFAATPQAIASESDFYLLPELAEHGLNPLTLEQQFSDLESEVAAISAQWLDIIRAGQPADLIPIPSQNRTIFSLFLVLQFLRTADARALLTALDIGPNDVTTPIRDSRMRWLHAEVLWDDKLINEFQMHIESATWVFAHNATGTPFVTSDNPVSFRTSDGRRWIKVGMLHSDAYVVYPLAPDVVFYCYPKRGKWLDQNIEQFDSRISPVAITPEMIESENTAQVFMASKFVVSNSPDFTEARRFAATIGTDVYAPRSEFM